MGTKMKKIFCGLLFMTSFLINASETKVEKALEIKAHVSKMSLSSNNLYRLELKEFAAAYFASEKFVPCLQKAIKENKEATLKVDAYSLKVEDCHID
jgi:hypothetical protein